MRLDKFARQAVTWQQNQPEKRQDRVTGEWEIVVTHCNRFVSLCANEVGCKDLGAPDEWLANQIISRLDQMVERHFLWRSCSAEHAQSEANRFKLVVAGRKNEPHGHVCLVVAGELGWSKKHGIDLPTVANVGADNFYGRLASFAFSFKAENPIKFWVWDGPYKPEAEVK